MKFFIITISAIIGSIAIIGCPTPPPSSTPLNTENIYTEQESECVPACNHLRSLGCEESNDLAYPEICTQGSRCDFGKCSHGRCVETCEMLCANDIKAGNYIGLDCWLSVDSCEELSELCK